MASPSPHGRHRAWSASRRSSVRLPGSRCSLPPTGPTSPQSPSASATSRHQIGGFACDFVVTWLTATTAQRATLARFITLPDPGPALPTTPAAVVTAPQSVSVIHTGTVGETDLYAATVSVTERPYASAQSTRAFYLVAGVDVAAPTASGDTACPHQRTRTGQRPPHRLPPGPRRGQPGLRAGARIHRDLLDRRHRAGPLRATPDPGWLRSAATTAPSSHRWPVIGQFPTPRHPAPGSRCWPPSWRKPRSSPPSP